ncbi:MAG: TauD/TfdA family dioxygenase [Ilumatobacteraceae bacterium]
MTTTALLDDERLSSVDIEPVTGVIGAEVTGVDLRRPLSPDVVAALTSALLDHHVLFFRDQHLDIDQQIAFSRYFGDPNPSHPVPGTGLAEQPEIYRPRSPAEATEGPPSWHADHIYMHEPSKISSLRAVSLPPVGGGTMWASQVAAYESLSPALQGFLDQLSVVHPPPPGFRAQLAAGGAPGRWNGRVIDRLDEVEHPLVVVHPESGKRSIFLHPGYGGGRAGGSRIPELSTTESDALVAFLVAHITAPERTVHFAWTPGALALWDNRVTIHRPVADYDPDIDRVLHRVSLQGEPPRGVPGNRFADR